MSVPYIEESEKKPTYSDQKDKWEIEKIPATAASKVLLYCNGPECWKSFKASKWALKKHFVGHILWLREGMLGWSQKGFATERGEKE